jgi:hypothetical protein
VIRALRFAGVLIASVWLGALAFHTFVVGPALNSSAAQSLIGAKFFAYVSIGMGQILSGWYFHLGAVCGFLALVHLFLENLYLGRGVSRRWLALLLTLFVVNLLGSSWLNPTLAALHQTQHRTNASAVEREAAARSFRLWHGVFQAMNVFMLAGVTALLWHTSNPTDTPRYVSSGKFRG